MGLVGEEPENPWLHDNIRRADKGGREGSLYAHYNNLHRVYEKVKIARDVITRQLVFYKHVGRLYTSDEWIRVNIESINNIPDVA